MLLAGIAFLLLAMFGILYGYKKGGELLQGLDKKEHKLFFWYPLIQTILIQTKLEQKLVKQSHATEVIKTLYHTQKPEEQVKLYWYQRIATVFTVISLFSLLSLVGTFMDQEGLALRKGRYLERPGYGDGSSEVKLDVEVQQEKRGAGQSNISDSQEVTVSVGERRYTEDEAEELFLKAIQYLKEKVRGNNPSLEKVTEKLNFYKAIPGTSITVTWIPTDYKLLSSDGSIYNNEIPKEGVATSVKAVLNYYEVKKEYVIDLHLMPKQYSEEEIFKQKLIEEMKSLSDRTSYDPLLELPSEVEGYKLGWKQRSSNTGVTIFILGFAATLMIWIYSERQLEQQMKKRKEQMLLDYPDIVNKFTLLINAGMTIRQAWFKISEDYVCKVNDNHMIQRHLYEEMLVTVRELKLGIPEKTAYEQFGRRVGLIPYIKFSALLSQNLIKGTRGFTDLLIIEATQAFEDRKEAVRRLGEEAGTKLLIPMMILLILVFLIIMIPAFMSFQMG